MQLINLVKPFVNENDFPMLYELSDTHELQLKNESYSDTLFSLSGEIGYMIHCLGYDNNIGLSKGELRIVLEQLAEHEKMLDGIAEFESIQVG